VQLIMWIKYLYKSYKQLPDIIVFHILLTKVTEAYI